MRNRLYNDSTGGYSKSEAELTVCYQESAFRSAVRKHRSRTIPRRALRRVML